MKFLIIAIVFGFILPLSVYAQSDEVQVSVFEIDGMFFPTSQFGMTPAHEPYCASDHYHIIFGTTIDGEEVYIGDPDPNGCGTITIHDSVSVHITSTIISHWESITGLDIITGEPISDSNDTSTDDEGNEPVVHVGATTTTYPTIETRTGYAIVLDEGCIKFVGTGKPGQTVHVFINEGGVFNFNSVGFVSTTVDENGNWEIVFKPCLEDGYYDVTVVYASEDGSEESTTDLPIIVDTGSGVSTTIGETESEYLHPDDGDDPRDVPPPTIYGEEIDTTVKKYFFAAATTPSHSWVELWDGADVSKRGLWAAGHKGSTPGPYLVHAGEKIDKNDTPPVPEAAGLLGTILTGGNGVIKNEGVTARGTAWIGFEITEKEYNKLVDYINNASTEYSVVGRNCVDFVIEVAEQIGISLPSATEGTKAGWIYSDPEAFEINIKKTSATDNGRNEHIGDWRSGPKWIKEQLESSSTSSSTSGSSSDSDGTSGSSSFLGSTKFSSTEAYSFFENTKGVSDASFDLKIALKELLISNLGDIPIYSIELQNLDDSSIGAIVEDWKSTKLSSGNTLLSTDNAPINPGQKLKLDLDISSDTDSILWRLFDETSSLGFGMVSENAQTFEQTFRPDSLDTVFENLDPSNKFSKTENGYLIINNGKFDISNPSEKIISFYGTAGDPSTTGGMFVTIFKSDELIFKTTVAIIDGKFDDKITIKDSWESGNYMIYGTFLEQEIGRISFRIINSEDTTSTDSNTSLDSNSSVTNRYVLPEYLKTTQIPITGKVTEYLRGAPVEINIMKPDGTTESIAALAKMSGEYSAMFSINDKSIPGIYNIEIKYDGNILEAFSIELISEQVPDWIKNNAKWWADGQIDDQSFVGGIEYLIKERIIKIDKIPPSSDVGEEKIPDWIKNNARWWADGLISEDDFVNGLEYMIKVGIISSPILFDLGGIVNNQGGDVPNDNEDDTNLDDVSGHLGKTITSANRPDLYINISTDSNPVELELPFGYVIDIGNKGKKTAYQVEVTLSFPPEIKVLNSSQCSGKQILTCKFFSLYSGETKKIFVVATIGDDSFFDKGWEINGKIYSPTEDENPDDNKTHTSEPKINSDIIRNSLDIVVNQESNFAELDLNIILEVDNIGPSPYVITTEKDENNFPIELVGGDIFSDFYLSIIVKNNGISEAKNPVVILKLPPNFDFSGEITGWQEGKPLSFNLCKPTFLEIRCELGNIPSGGKFVLGTSIDIKYITPKWSIEGQVHSDTFDPIVINNKKELSVNFS